jgi:peptide/nickel transport system permease protein
VTDSAHVPEEAALVAEQQLPVAERQVSSRGRPWRKRARAFAQNKLATAGLVLIVAIALFCFVGPFVYHTDQVQTNLLNTNLPPGGQNPLGTDNVGYDILGRLMAGGQSSLEVGLAVSLLATTFGALYGAIAGWLGGIVDAVMMRIVDMVLSMPVVLVFVFLATVYRPTVPLLILVLALLSWLGPARLIRGETLSQRTREYVEAAQSAGARAPRLVLRHILPNSIGTVIVNATFQVADAIIWLALLSYLGFSLPPPAATWGGMLSNGTSFLLDGYWWEIYPAGLMILLTVIAFNFIGDGLRDSFEVRLQSR